MSDLEDYIKDNYGSCTRGANCYWERDQLGAGCLRQTWLGRLCKYWRPTQASTCEELLAEMLALYGCTTARSAQPQDTSDQTDAPLNGYEPSPSDPKAAEGRR